MGCNNKTTQCVSALLQHLATTFALLVLNVCHFGHQTLMHWQCCNQSKGLHVGHKGILHRWIASILNNKCPILTADRICNSSNSTEDPALQLPVLEDVYWSCCCCWSCCCWSCCCWSLLAYPAGLYPAGLGRAAWYTTMEAASWRWMDKSVSDRVMWMWAIVETKLSQTQNS